VPAIAKSIHEQIEDYRVHAPEGISIGITGSGRGLLLDHDKDISSLSSLSASSISRYNIEMENRHGHDNLFIGELRVLIKVISISLFFFPYLFPYFLCHGNIFLLFI